MSASEVETRYANLRLGSAFGVLAFLAFAPPALAADECGAAPVGGSVTCTAAGNTYPNGIEYSSPAGALTVNINGDVVVNASANPGVSVATGAGNLAVNAAAGSSVTVAGVGNDAYRLFATSGTITATSGAINSSGANTWGINAASDTGAINITGTTTTTAGANGRGIYVFSHSGPITLTTGTVTTSGDSAEGVTVRSTIGNITINGGTVTTTGTNDSIGIQALTFGAGTLTINGTTTSTAGAGATGIAGTTNTGLLTINVGTVTTTGANAVAVSADSSSGNIVVTGGAVSTQGAGSIGLNAVTGGTGTISVTGGTYSTTGDAAHAVFADNGIGTGAVTIAVSSASTTGSNSQAVRALSDGQVTAGATTVNTTGAGGFGIVASGVTGAAVNYGNITTTGVGAGGVLAISSTGAATVTGTPAGLLSTTGAGSNGIQTSGVTGLTINVGRVSATGLGSQGIIANSTGGAVNVTSTGIVANDYAVVAVNTGGATSVVLSGTNNSVNNSAVLISGTTSAALTLNGGTLNGAIDGAVLNSATGSTINNTGTITAGNSALTVSGGAATVNNNIGGTITGSIALTSNADTVTNAGTFNATTTSLLGGGNDVFNNSGTFNANTVGGTSLDFGAGAADVFNNSGTLRVLPAAVAAGTSTIANLETFNNSGGLIDLRNGHTGDVVNLGAANFVGSGNSGLAIDVNLNTAPTTTDLLTIGGAATGSTAVTINRLGSPAVLSTAAGTTFVDAGAGSSANAFVIAPASQVDGVIQYGVVFDPTTNNFALVSAPSAAAYRTSLYSDGIRNIWLQSADAWTAHMRELRDNIAANGPGGSGGRFWFQGFGNWEKRTSSRTVTFNGITSNVDLGYNQDYYGFQLGMDLGAPVGDEGGFNFGATGGYQSSNMNFPNAADQVRFNVVNGGLYASFKSGIFFINALGKYDHYWGETRSPAGLFAFDIDGSVWGAKAEAGLRFGDAFWVEPSVSVSWTNSDFDNFTVPSGTFAIDDEDGVRGKAGARIGWTTQWGDAKVSLYGGANYVKEFRGRTNVVFTSGGQTAAFSSPRNQDYGEGILGVNIGSASGKLSGFFEGHYAEGNDYDGYGVRGGIRVRF